jgi:DNA-directed RNA polymerase subunit beta
MPRVIQNYTTGQEKLNFGADDNIIDVPNLIDVQLSSYRDFLQAHRSPTNRLRQGLQEIFLDIFPIQDFTGNLILEFVEYKLGLARCKDCPSTKGTKVRECSYYDCTFKEKECTFASIDGVPYRIKYDPNECKKRDVTYGVSLSIIVRLINKSSGEVKEQEIFLANLPCMTARGTFIINGAERVVVSQLHRSPGVYYKYDKLKKQYLAKVIPYRGAWLEFELDVIKDTIHVRIDRKRKQAVTVLFKALGYSNEEMMELFANNEYIANTLKYDKTKSQSEALADVYSKMRPGEPFIEENAHTLLNMLFFDPRKYDLADVGRYKINQKLRIRDRILGKPAGATVYSPETGEIIVEPGDEVTRETSAMIEDGNVPIVKLMTADEEIIEVFNEFDFEEIVFRDKEAFRKSLLGKTLGENIIDPKSNAIVYTAKTTITPEMAFKMNRMKLQAVKIISADGTLVTASRSQYEKLSFEEEELLKKKIVGREIVRPIKYSDAGSKHVKTIEAGTVLTKELFSVLNEARVETIYVKKGRILTKSDIVSTVRYLIDLCNGLGHIDDIDHLGNRRVRRVGELLQNQFRMSLIRMERDIKERMTIQDVAQVSSQSLINARPVAAMIKDFFGTSQLSQFMDQTNPLSELTHKRRISALGPGGVRRERAGYEVRDVHPTHYGRICPIETPEGPNAGLISSLAIYSNINEYGFIESPFRKITGGKMAESVDYLDAYEEDEYKVCPADLSYVCPKDAKYKAIKDAVVSAKFKSGEESEYEFSFIPVVEADLMQISSLQVVSVATALIPFLENDDANRALMGTNMQRQAVPLLKTEPAFIGTGLEHKVAKDSGVMVVANSDGVVKKVEAGAVWVERSRKTFREGLIGHVLREPVLKANGKDVLYDAGTTIDEAKSKELDALSYVKSLKVSTIDGEIVYVNRADFSEKKTHYDKYEILKYKRSNQGTCINQKVLARVGQKVRKGDVLADGPATCEGELALGRNIIGIFMPWEGYNFEDAILLSERLVKEDFYTSIHIEEYEIETRDTRLGPEEITCDIPNISSDALRNLDEEGIVRIGAEVESGDILVGKVTPKGETELTAEDKLLRAIFGEKAREVRNTSFVVPHGEGGKIVDVMIFTRENKDELPHGVNKLVRVFIAQKRKITEGDKMAGRHGNKGVIARILPEKDMPYLEDGTPVEIVLNPLGVPSRMNLGQVLETYLGLISKELGFRIEVPIFESAPEVEIRAGLSLQRLINTGRLSLYDPLSRECFGYCKFENIDKKEFIDKFIELSTKDYNKISKEGKLVPSIAAFLETLKFAFTNYSSVVYDGKYNRPLGTTKKLTEKEFDKIILAPKAAEKGKKGMRQTFDFSKIINFTDEVEIKNRHLEVVYFVESQEDENGEMKYTKIEDKEKFPEVTSTLKTAGSENLIGEFKRLMTSVDLTESEDGKQFIYDGRTGVNFDNRVTVGYMYIMKLAHLVDDKIHARATGPYSLVTQQPLGGKAQFGGQRFGEMEVWALEAYGAAHILQELLTVKSDDVEGRVEVYGAIIKGENLITPKVPESFKVLVSELQSLGLKIELQKNNTLIPIKEDAEAKLPKAVHVAEIAQETEPLPAGDDDDDETEVDEPVEEK